MRESYEDHLAAVLAPNLVPGESVVIVPRTPVNDDRMIRGNKRARRRQPRLRVRGSFDIESLEIGIDQPARFARFAPGIGPSKPPFPESVQVNSNVFGADLRVFRFADILLSGQKRQDKLITLRVSF